MTIFLFMIGLSFLIFGADILIRGSSRLAFSFGITPLVIGLTVVSFGTSAPELAVSAQAAMANQANLSVGNVVGSNIFNILFVLGVSALIAPLIVSPNLISRDVPIMIGVSIVAYLFMLNQFFSLFEGVILFSTLIAYLWYLVYQSRKDKIIVEEGSLYEKGSGSKLGLIKNIGFIILGLSLLVLGSQLLVDSAVKFAKYLGVSELVIGITIVAIGTSLPEVVTSVVATIRGERDIAVGNVIGSNIFNMLGVFGVAGIFSPNGIVILPSLINFDFPFMIFVAIICLPIFISGGIISRWEGFLLFSIYVVYTMHIILVVSNSSLLPLFNSAIFYLLVPMVILTIISFYFKNRLIK
jgi:cation:H+ antiporter